MNELALFAGVGGGILGGKLLGWRTVCAVEWERYPASVLCARQNDGVLPPFPIWDDIQTFDGKPWEGIVDVVSGGFPCQDISVAGKGAGIEGERSGMWKHMARVVCEVRPKYVYVENSSNLASRGLGTVLGDLSSMGFNAKWGVVSAADVGAPHQRDRIWILATNTNHKSGSAKQKREHQRTKKFIGSCPGEMESFISNTNSAYGERNKCAKRINEESTIFGKYSWWETEPNVGRMANGVAARMDRLKAIGNGQVSLVATEAWKLLIAQK